MPTINLPAQKTEKRGHLSRPEKPVKPTLVAPDEYVPKLRNRTPEQLERDRAALFSGEQKLNPLLPGRTVWDMIVGQWPGDETDEEIAVALAELS